MCLQRRRDAVGAAGTEAIGAGRYPDQAYRKRAPSGIAVLEEDLQINLALRKAGQVIVVGQSHGLAYQARKRAQIALCELGVIRPGLSGFPPSGDLSE